MPETINITLSDSQQTALHEIAAASKQSEDTLIAEAIDRFVSDELVWIKKVKEGIAAADRGEFASEEDMQRIFNLYKPAPE